MKDSRITAWLPLGGNIESQHGSTSHLDWLRAERNRFALKGKITHIKQRYAGTNGRGYRTAALFMGPAT